MEEEERGGDSWGGGKRWSWRKEEVTVELGGWKRRRRRNRKEEEVEDEVEREGGNISGNLRRRDAISTCQKTEYSRRVVAACNTTPPINNQSERRTLCEPQSIIESTNQDDQYMTIYDNTSQWQYYSVCTVVYNVFVILFVIRSLTWWPPPHLVLLVIMYKSNFLCKNNLRLKINKKYISGPKIPF